MITFITGDGGTVEAIPMGAEFELIGRDANRDTRFTVRMDRADFLSLREEMEAAA